MNKRVLFIFFTILTSCFAFATDPLFTPTQFQLQFRNKGDTTIYFSDSSGQKIDDVYINFGPIEGNQTTAEIFLHWSIFESGAVEISVEEREMSPSNAEECFGLSTNLSTTPGRIKKLNYRIQTDQPTEENSYTVKSPSSFDNPITNDEDALLKEERTLVFSYDSTYQNGANETIDYTEYDERSATVRLTLELTAPGEGGSQAFMKGLYNGYLIAEMKSML